MLLIHRFFALCLLSIFVGCSLDANDDADSSAKAQAIIGADTFLYLTCNATGWQPNPDTRLTATEDPGIYELEYSVELNWMVETFDQCTFVETNKLDGWGSWQRYYGLSGGPEVIDVPEAGQMVANKGYFGVRYPELGDYRVRVDLQSGTLWFEEADSPPARHLTIAAYIIESYETCFIGDPCTGDDCIGLRDDANDLVIPFTETSFQAVATSDPQVQTAAQTVCVNMTLDASEVAEIESELVQTAENVSLWSQGAIELDIRVIRIPHVDLPQSRWGAGVWIGPWNFAETAADVLDFVPDFNLVIPPIRDDALQLHHDLGGCGGAFGADIGVAGAGWSWIPKTRKAFWFDCAEQPVLTHEWLHQVHFAYQNLSGFDDLYRGSYPACGLGDPDAHKWFPDSHECGVDPDYDGCGASCGTNDDVNSHILREHWDPDVVFIANHCTNGIQDYGESAIDFGGPCLDGFSGESTDFPAAQPIFVPTPTPLP